MGSCEDRKTPKSEEVSPSKQEQNNIHLYPDWSTVQTYYGPGVPVSSSYLNSAIMPGNVSPHMWGPPQHLISPYGVPYTAVYSPGVVYAPVVPLVATHMSGQMLSNSSDNSAEVDGERSDCRVSQSEKRHIIASSNASDGNTKALQSQRNSDSIHNLSTDNDVKDHAQSSTMPDGDAEMTFRRVSAINMAPENAADKSSESPNRIAETGTTCTAAGRLPADVWIQNERQLKRERRKQSNRESARKSRLRKQAETEELMETYETQKVENIMLQSELKKLMEDSEKLRVENAEMTEKLNVAEAPHLGEATIDEKKPDSAQSNRCEKGSMLKNLNLVKGNKGRQCENPDNSSAVLKRSKFEAREDAVTTS